MDLLRCLMTKACELRGALGQGGLNFLPSLLCRLSLWLDDCVARHQCCKVAISRPKAILHPAPDGKDSNLLIGKSRCLMSIAEPV
eukprot:6380104-Amphidinium_carterae.1